MSETDPKLKTEAGQDLVRAIFGTDAIAENGRNRELGKARGLIREIDPDWWKPMTDEEAARLFDLRAQHHE